MSILYKPIPKKNPQNPDDPIKFYPQAIKRNTVSLDHLSQAVARESTVSKADCYAVIISLVDQIEAELKNGNNVKLKGLGTFSIRVKGKPADTADALTSKDIEKISISYRAESSLRTRMGEAEFEKTQ